MSKHKTATVRAKEVVRAYSEGWCSLQSYIKCALQLHAKAALARSKPKKPKKRCSCNGHSHDIPRCKNRCRPGSAYYCEPCVSHACSKVHGE